MASEFLKPMLDVGSPRVFNCNVISQRIVAEQPDTPLFFRNRPMNRLVFIKDAVPDGPKDKGIGTKLYFPFNENDIYEGGRTIFAHDKNLERALTDNFGEGALKPEALAEDLKLLALLDRLPSLDPFLMRDVMRNNGLEANPAYFEVGAELWSEIETYILKSFEPLVEAAFSGATASDDKVRTLVQKIWEAQDLDVLRPLVAALQLPAGQELAIFSAWKGINFYAFQMERARPKLIELLNWLADVKIPVGAVSSTEREEIKAAVEAARVRLREEWQLAENIVHEYQESYDKLFKKKVGSTDFLAFLKRSDKAYWDIGNALGKTGHASYCWDIMSNRFPGRKLPWEPMREIIQLMAKIFPPEKKMATGMSW